MVHRFSTRRYAFPWIWHLRKTNPHSFNFKGHKTLESTETSALNRGKKKKQFEVKASASLISSYPPRKQFSKLVLNRNSPKRPAKVQTGLLFWNLQRRQLSGRPAPASLLPKVAQLRPERKSFQNSLAARTAPLVTLGQSLARSLAIAARKSVCARAWICATAVMNMGGMVELASLAGDGELGKEICPLWLLAREGGSRASFRSDPARRREVTLCGAAIRGVHPPLLRIKAIAMVAGEPRTAPPRSWSYGNPRRP